MNQRSCYAAREHVGSLVLQLKEHSRSPAFAISRHEANAYRLGPMALYAYKPPRSNGAAAELLVDSSEQDA